MEYLHALPISAHCERYNLEPIPILRLLGEVVTAVDQVHKSGICHGNIGPATVLVVGRATDARAQLWDFSRALPVDATGLERDERLAADVVALVELAQQLLERFGTPPPHEVLENLRPTLEAVRLNPSLEDFVTALRRAVR